MNPKKGSKVKKEFVWYEYLLYATIGSVVTTIVYFVGGVLCL